MNVLPIEKQVACIAALTEGASIRSVERMTGVHRDTIMRLGRRVGATCASAARRQQAPAARGYSRTRSASNATARVLRVLADAGQPMLTSEIKELVPELAGPTVRSVLFHQKNEGTILKSGRRPFRWSLNDRHDGEKEEGR